jgi:hypothetical protein
MQKNLPADRKGFAVNREVLRSKIMRALQSRHDAGLTDKVIGRAIGRHPDTVGNWRLGLTEMQIGDLIALDNFFASMGDWGFVEAVMGDLAVRRRLRAQQLREQAAQLDQAAEMMEAVA